MQDHTEISSFPFSRSLLPNETWEHVLAHLKHHEWHTLQEVSRHFHGVLRALIGEADVEVESVSLTFGTEWTSGFWHMSITGTGGREIKKRGGLDYLADVVRQVCPDGRIPRTSISGPEPVGNGPFGYVVPLTRLPWGAIQKLTRLLTDAEVGSMWLSNMALR